MSWKRWLIVVCAVLVLGGAYVLAAHLSGGALPSGCLAVGGDKAWLRKTTLRFWEDIQFKDFKSAAKYHDPTVQEDVDIPYLLQRLFLERPEAIEIMEYEVIAVDIDSTKLRSRVKARVKARRLVAKRIDQMDVLFYYKRKSETAPWYMDFENSLRKVEYDPGKKHN